MGFVYACIISNPPGFAKENLEDSLKFLSDERRRLGEAVEKTPELGRVEPELGEVEPRAVFAPSADLVGLQREVLGRRVVRVADLDHVGRERVGVGLRSGLEAGLDLGVAGADFETEVVGEGKAFRRAGIAAEVLDGLGDRVGEA